jgi:Sec-independent protein secretion pathway component TatC
MRVVGLVLSEMAGFGALGLLLYYLPVSGAASLPDAWAMDRVVAYILLFLAPLLVFLPLSLALRLGPVWALGTGSWAMLGYLLIFSAPPDRQSADIFTYIAFLAILFVALGTAFAVPLSALSKRFLPPSPHEWLRATRQGALLALFAVTLLAMSPLGVLNWLNVLLVFTIIALTEFFFLARA